MMTRMEYFTKVFNEGKKQLFECVNGKEWLLVPKRAGGNLQIFKIFGIIIAHSLLQSGPHFNFLAPWVVDVLFNEDGTSGDISLEDIPINSATGCLINFVKLLRKCDTNEAINDLFNTADGPAFEQIISSSDWEPTEAITLTNKDILINLLLHEETITRRGGKVKAIREGLIFMGFKEYLCLEAARSLFHGSPKYIDTDEFLNLIQWEHSEDDTKKVESMSWLKSFIKQATQRQLTDLLKFSTGFEDMSSSQDKTIFLEFLPGEKLPKAAVCTTTLQLPTGLSSKEEFFAMFEKALEYECVGFAEF